MRDIQLNQKEMYPNANALEDGDIFDKILPALEEESGNEEPEEWVAEINHQM